MIVREHEPLGPKTTMRIGGTARWFAELADRSDVEAACAFARERSVPLILLGSGSNTIFDDREIDALVVRIKADKVEVEGDRVAAEAGKNLAMLINELAKKGRDLSPLTGIPGTVGAAIFGNAGQGPQGIWIDRYVRSVTAYIDGLWKILPREECRFRYRESIFKEMLVPSAEEGITTPNSKDRPKTKVPPVIWEVVLGVPEGDPAAIAAEVQRLLQVRIKTQPHLKTAGSCFKAAGGTPAWKLIDDAGLRGARFGGIEISQKHANFLLNVERATFADAVAAVEAVHTKVDQPLEVEMRFIQPDGTLKF